MKKIQQKLLLLLITSLFLGLSQGDKIPSFSTKNQDGKVVQLDDFKGKYLLIYFYPKDDTPGCTVEAKEFRDNFEKMEKINLKVVGISLQGEKSHKKFHTKLSLPFDLLVDDDEKIAKSLGVGMIPLLGLTKRQSFLIDPNGKLAKTYLDVDPGSHAKNVIEDVLKLSAPASPPAK
jgi:peroxiredoxin Q/BCP